MKACITAIVLSTLLFSASATAKEKSIEEMSLSELRAYARQLQAEVAELREQARSARQSERHSKRQQTLAADSRRVTTDDLSGIGSLKWGASRDEVLLRWFPRTEDIEREVIFQDDNVVAVWRPYPGADWATLALLWFKNDQWTGSTNVRLSNVIKIDSEYLDFYNDSARHWETSFGVKPRAIWADGERSGSITAGAIKSGTVRMVVERSTDKGTVAMVLQRVAGDRLAIVHHRFAKGYKAPTDAELDALLAKIPRESDESR